MVDILLNIYQRNIEKEKYQNSINNDINYKFIFNKFNEFNSEKRDNKIKIKTLSKKILSINSIILKSLVIEFSNHFLYFLQ